MAPDIPPSPAVELMVTTSSDWQAGYCNDVVVRNASQSTLDWVVEIDIDGTITDHWSSQVSAQSGVVRFEGVAWNDILEAGGETSFGFCANR